jgi:hypothetical protein
MSNSTHGEQKDLVQQHTTGGPQPGEIYRHYRNNGLYVVVCRSIRYGTLEPLVTYRSNASGRCWTRTLEDFAEIIGFAADNRSGPCPRYRRVDE